MNDYIYLLVLILAYLVAGAYYVYHHAHEDIMLSVKGHSIVIKCAIYYFCLIFWVYVWFAKKWFKNE